MAEGLKRHYGEGDLHFITFSCFRRLPLLKAARARDIFVQELARVRAETGFRLIGYVVMPEHVHLLMSEPKIGTPSQATRDHNKIQSARSEPFAHFAACPFAREAGQCNNTFMRKIQFSALTLLTAGFLLTGHAAAQQTPAATTQQSPAATPAPATKAQTTPAAKTPATASTAKKPAAPLTLKTPKDKASYAIGMNIGKGMHQQAVDVDTAILLRGLKDGLAGGKTLMTDQEAQAALTALQQEVRKRQEENAKAQGEVNKKEGEAFLAANKAKEGVVTLPSGLQYKILQQGNGPKPTVNDTVVCNYRGTLLNGKEFDSSYKRGQPATFPLGQVIKGWTEALQLMPVGSKWQIVLPPDLAYGERSAGPDITPNSTLVFEVELMSIKPPIEKPTPKPALEQPGGKPVVNPVDKPADTPTAKPADQPKP